MTRRGWLLFAAMGVIWGVPYLLIKVAVEDVEPPIVVFGRTALASLILVPLALRTGAIRPALARWKPVLAFAAIEMAGPWFLLTNAEKELPSGLTGLLVAGVPLVGTVTAFALGDRHALHRTRLAGLAVGLGGVALLVAGDLRSEGGVPWGAVLAVALVCVGYAVAPFILARSLHDVAPMGVIAVSLASVALLYSPLAWFARPDRTPPADSIMAILGLAAICTGLAFVVFFALIREIGPARATLITFVNPAVAIALGALVLDEKITAATIAGFVLVVGGCWLATRPPPDGAPSPTSPAPLSSPTSPAPTSGHRPDQENTSATEAARASS